MPEELSIMDIKNTLQGIRGTGTDKVFYDIFEEPFLSQASLKVPEAFYEKVYSWFAKKDSSGKPIETMAEVIKRVENQEIIKVFNKITCEGAVFNELRARRPIIYQKQIKEGIIQKKECDFCEPELFTALDGFGRIRHNGFMTGSNITKAESAHSNIIYYPNENHSFEFNLENLASIFETAEKWFVQINKEDPSLIYPFLAWNFGYKAGASFLHPHIQIAMSPDSPPAKFRKLKQDSENYFDKHQSDYFKDLFQAHNLVGLGLKREDSKILFYLTPIKEKETILISEDLADLIDSLHKVLKTYVNDLKVSNFNLALYRKPLKDLENWKNFPCVLRIVDRGNSESKSADIAGHELYGNNVISTDPYIIKRAVEKNL